MYQKEKKNIEEKISILSSYLNTKSAYISGFFILVISLIVTYEVIMRFLFYSPTNWVLEVSIYLGIACVFLSTGYTLKENSHISVDILTRKLSYKNRNVLFLLTSILSLIYIIILFYKGGELAYNSYINNDLSPTPIGLPMFIPWSFVPIGSFLVALEIVNQIIKSINKLKTKSQSPDKKGNLIVILTFSLTLLTSIYFLSYDGINSIALIVILLLLLVSGMPVAFVMGFLGVTGVTIP